MDFFQPSTLQRVIVACIVLAAPAIARAQTDSLDIRGNWRTPDKATIRIAPCGRALCGRIIDFVPPPGLTKTDTVDAYNPEPTKRRRKILGLSILSDMKREGEVWRGSVYDPKRGISANATASLETGERLTLRGCIRIVLFKACETQVWQRLKP